MKYRAVSLFSGAGGLDLGFKLTGLYQLVFANDVSQSAALTYANNFDLKLVTCRGAMWRLSR